MNNLYPLILEFERRGVVKRTFRRLDPEQQQRVILAIVEEAAQAGPADLNVKRTAERAGISVGSLYQYFGSRTALLEFAAELVVRVTIDLFNSYRPYLAEMPLREALHAYVTGGVSWSREQAGIAGFFGAAAYHGEPNMVQRVVAPVSAVLLEMVRDILGAAQQRGEIRPGVDLEALARVLNALTIAVGDAQLMPNLNAYYRLYDAEMPPERVMAALLDLVVSGMGAGPHETKEGTA